MKFKLVEQQPLSEATLSNVINNVTRGLASVGATVVRIDNDKKFILCDTPLGNRFCIPVEEQNRTASNDYKKLRFSGNGFIRNGEIYDAAGNHMGRAYYGVSIAHQHLDYDPNVYEYSRNEDPTGSPIDFSTFINDIRSGKY